MVCVKKKGKLKSIFSIVLLIVIAGLVLYFSLRDNYQEILNGIINANKIWLLLGLFLIIGYWFFKALIFYRFTRKFKKDYTFKKAFRLQLLTNFFNAVTPFSSGGQPFQVYTLKKQGVELTDSTNIIIQNFIVYQIALVSLGLISIGANTIFHFFEDVHVLKYLVTIGFIMNTLIIIGLFLIAFGKRFNKFIISKVIKLLSKMKIVKKEEKTLENWNNYINNFHEGAKLLIADKKFFLRAILDAFIALVCQYLIPVVILYSTGDYTSFNGLISIVACSYVMLIGSFVPIPGGTGGLEYGFIQFYGNFIGGSTLRVIMILWRAITYYFGLILGAIVVNIKEKEVKKCE